MFRHQGQSRTKKHNLQIAKVLSLVAGIVNVSGFLSIQQLTTNVTGHFAQFIYEIDKLEFWKGTIFIVYIFSFLAGSFSSGLLIEFFRHNKRMNVFVIPILIESLILIFIVTLFNLSGLTYHNTIACLLLFSMGLQNSYVTKISNAIVRTTHLTGLFTDLGIEISQLFFKKDIKDRKDINSVIRLRINIILFFFLGGIIGGFCYSTLTMKLNALLVAVVVLLVSLFYDDLKFKSKVNFKNIINK